MVNLLGGPHFDDLARIHDVHPIGIAGDHAEVVGDDDQGHAKAPGQVFLGLAAQGQGDHDPLAHAAAQVMRILLEAPAGVGNPDHAEQLQGPVVGLLLAAAEMQANGLCQLLPDTEHRV
jgi:hypothetical protein